MPKLPGNLVQSFDNPLRRTARPMPQDLDADHFPPDAENTAPSIDENSIDENSGGVVIPIAAKPKAKVKSARRAAVQVGDAIAPEVDAAIDHRITVRIEDDTRCALESECHRRRIAGEKTNVTEIARGILSQWARQQAK